MSDKAPSLLAMNRRLAKVRRENGRLARLAGYGQRMSNFLYNASQASDIPEPWRRQMKMMVDSWDAEKVKD